MLAGAGLHTTAAGKSQDERDSVKYKGASQYVPFPYKDLPLLVYQSENQPPVHVVEKSQKQNAAQPQQVVSSEGNDNGKMQQQTGPAVYQMAEISNILASTIHQELPNEAPYNAPQPAAQVKPSSPMQKQNAISYQVQNNMRQNAQPQSYATVPQNMNKNNAQDTVQYMISNMGQQQAQNYAYQIVNQQQYPGSQPTPQQAQLNNGMQYISNIKVQPQDPQLQYNIQQQKNQYMQAPSPQQQNQYMQALNPQQQNQYLQAPSPQQQKQYMQAPSPQQQKQYAQMQNQQPVQNNQAQNSAAYPNNVQQAPPMDMQQIVYQTTTNNNAAYGAPMSAIPQSQPNQYNVPQQMINKNPPQKMVQNSPQAQVSDENEQDQQYLSIALYPYDIRNTNYAQQPQQYYKIVLPPINEQYQEENSNEPKQMNANPPAEPQKQQMQQMPMQGQAYRYTNMVSSQSGPNQNQQRNAYGDARKQMNALDNKPPQKQTPKQQETPEESSDSEEEEIEYQQILIHIPHMLAAQPQILVQQDEKEQVTPYTGTAQVAAQMNRTSQQMKTALKNFRKNPYYNLANKNRHAASTHSSMSLGGSMNSNYLRQMGYQKFPSEYQSGSESGMYPYRLTGNSFRPRPVMPHRSRHPGVFESSNTHYTSTSPYYTTSNSFRNSRKRSPYLSFDQMSASVNRPSFLSPSRPHQSLYSSFPDELLAEASFQSPTFSNPKNKINITSLSGAEDLFSEFDDLSDLTSFDLSALSDSGKTFSGESSDKFLQKLTRDVINQGMSAGLYPDPKIVRPGQNAMSVLNTPQLISQPVPIRINAGPVPIVPLAPQYPQQFIYGNRHMAPYPGIQTGKGKNTKYGTFIKKLTTLSNILLKQSIGKKSQIMPREETKTEEPIAEEYNVEEIDDPVVPEEESPKPNNVNKDSQGLDGISIPLNPSRELSRRISKPQEDIPRPPIIVYKGNKPPVEVYGTKEDIEGPKDTPATSSSKLEADVDRNDYLKVMYSIIPDFLKHSITNRNDGTLAPLGDGWQPINLPQIKPTDDIEDRIALEDKVKVKAEISEAKDFLKSSKSSKEPVSSFNEDIEELAKLLHKDEKSDIFSS
ncbi:uncharacterized protein TNIN_451931 [Trichonephila inaurata madagascariensis]|uniref:Uncharacterized protein n=1 Tax=Trichonephila inaurata madagascariensis TaxID=2747483 RepID=A0A8X6XAC1_9ARAC|nr:uncharacterized protein TNIN_451931 [Trichonephila inaurata madagascariensis]